MIVSLPEEKDNKKFQEYGAVEFTEPAFFEIFNFPDAHRFCGRNKRTEHGPDDPYDGAQVLRNGRRDQQS
ncbi:MAG: hypothetical protein WDO14_16670 [Bacteroidota bacterium]